MTCETTTLFRNLQFGRYCVTNKASISLGRAIREEWDTGAISHGASGLSVGDEYPWESVLNGPREAGPLRRRRNM